MSDQTGNLQATMKFKILGMNAKTPVKYNKEEVMSGIEEVVTKEKPHLAFFQDVCYEKQRFQQIFKKKYEIYGNKKAMIVIDLEEFEVIDSNQLLKQVKIDESSFGEMEFVKVYTNMNPKETFICVSWHEDKIEDAKQNLGKRLQLLKTVCNHREKKLPALIVGGFNIAMDEIHIDDEPSFKIQPFESESKGRLGNSAMPNFFITKNLDLEEVHAVYLKSVSSQIKLGDMFNYDPITCVLPKANIKTNENSQAESAPSQNQTETPPLEDELLNPMENLQTNFTQPISAQISESTESLR